MTSAVSFVATGSAVLLLTLRPRAMSAFTVAHAVPLSLGLTSFLGYLVGVTYVLPFKLGSQMPVHTAAAFLIYAGGMLSYAWRHSPRTREGLPKWLPAVPAVTLPLLFVGISDAGNGGSMLAWLLPLFVGVMSDGLVDLAAYRLTKTRIAYKGLTLISVPVIFVLAFVLLVNRVMRNNKKAEASYLQSKEVIAQTDVVLESLQDAESGIRGYVITSDPAFREPFDRSSQRASEGIKRLQNLVQDNPTQAARATRLGAITGEKLAQLEKQLRMVRAGDSDGTIAQVRSKAGLLTMDEFRREMADFLTEEHKLDEARRAFVEESWQRFNWLLIAGASIDILVTLISKNAFVSDLVMAETHKSPSHLASNPL